MPAASGPSIAEAWTRIALCVQIHIAGGSRRRHLAPVNDDLATGIRFMQQPESAAAQTGSIGLDHGERRADRYRRIESIAARSEDLLTGLGRQRMRRGDSGFRRR